MAKAEIGAGDVVLSLPKDEIVLTPTANALKMLSRQGGGIPGMVQRCMNFEFDSIMMVVQYGATLNPVQLKNHSVEQQVFEAGISNIAPLCIRYLTILSNGGKPPEDPDAVDQNAGGEEDQDPLATS